MLPQSPGRASSVDGIQPIVLVGGMSRRFGRDKLREPVGDGWLVDRPIAVLRAVFGARVAAVGACDPAVSARADVVIDDIHPAAGPIGGIISALTAFGSDVFVLPGDLPRITPDAVARLFGAALSYPDAWAVLAGSPRPEPCIGVYRRPALEVLLRALGEGRHRLVDALPRDHVVVIEMPRECLVNANRPEDLVR
jgi:molybdopterin-guanine dinucleotide biosynthesis protein A